MAGWGAYVKHRDIFISNLAIYLCTIDVCCATWALTKHAHKKRVAAHTKMEINMPNITYRDR